MCVRVCVQAYVCTFVCVPIPDCNNLWERGRRPLALKPKGHQWLLIHTCTRIYKWYNTHTHTHTNTQCVSQSCVIWSFNSRLRSISIRNRSPINCYYSMQWRIIYWHVKLHIKSYMTSFTSLFYFMYKCPHSVCYV